MRQSPKPIFNLVSLALLGASFIASSPNEALAAAPSEGLEASDSKAEENTSRTTGGPLPTPPPASDEALGTAFHQGLVLASGRTPLSPPDPELMQAKIQGEYQVRYSALRDLPLRARPGGPESLGQTQRLVHWLRLTPRFQFREDLELVGQIDVPRGLIAGQPTQEVSAANPDYAERFPLEVAPRWLYLSYNSPIGVLRIGQQPSHWGLGLLANDGDRQSLFGDYSGGSIVERVLFATKPAGKNSGLTLALAGDLVFKDRQASLTDEEYAWQGVLAISYADKEVPAHSNAKANQLGLYAAYRHQTSEASALKGTRFDESLKVLALDATGSFNARLPGNIGHVFGGFEVAYLHGTTSLIRNNFHTAYNEREKVRSLGALAQLGAVLTEGQGQQRYGEWVMQMELGWASGDADPHDGTTRRFSFDPNHNVGLLLFDEVLAWKTARAASIGQHPELSNRPAPGLERLPSDGGVFGATYIYPTVIYRPLSELDLKGGLVLAQATSAVVDPVQLATSGRYVNFDGGPASGRDLGLELDLGVEYRFALDYGMTLELGAQAGILFPGKAFNDASGNSIGNQYLGVGRMGLQF